MKKNIFKYLRKKILEYSTFTEEITNSFHIHKIECLGFNQIIILPLNVPSKKFKRGMLIDKLVENPKFLKKLEQVETRKENLKTLLE